MKKFKTTARKTYTVEEAFNEFILAKEINGIKKPTLNTYKAHFKAIAKHIDITSHTYSRNTIPIVIFVRPVQL